MKNPVIEKTRKEGYEKGFQKGIELGKEAFIAGQEKWVNDILDWFDNLSEVPGIGKKTVDKVANHFTNTFKR